MNNDANYVCVLECRKNWNPAAPAYFVLGRCESQGEYAGRQEWSTDKWPLNVLCNQCFELSEYSERDIQKLSVGNKDQAKPLPTRIWCIEVQCARESCDTLRKIYYQAGIGSVKEGILLEISDKQARIPCQQCRQATELTFQSCKNAYVVAEVYT